LTEIGELVDGLPPDSSPVTRAWIGGVGPVSATWLRRRHFGPELPRLQPTVVDELPLLIAAVAPNRWQEEPNSLGQEGPRGG
jgi:hypothetical protein